MEKAKLKQLFLATATNFNFKLSADGSFEPLFNIIHEQTKKVSDDVINKKFQQLWLLTNDEWHKKFNLAWGGYPSLASWLEILVEKPLNDEDIAKKKREYEERLKLQIWKLIAILNDNYFQRVYYNKYIDPNYIELKLLVDKFCNVKEELNPDKIKKMAIYLRGELDRNKSEFCDKLNGILRKQQPLLLK